MKLVPLTLLALSALLAASSLPASAWERAPYEDAEVVARSELIVVASIKDDSVTVVPHPRKGDEGRSWETHATLLIHEVIKGELREKELPIVIRYGLDVYVDDAAPPAGALDKETPLPKPKKSMTIIDTGNSSIGGPPVAVDARKDNLWCLRHAGERAAADDKGFGIVDPQDIQPLALKKYLQAYMQAPAEPHIRNAVQLQPEIAARATRYLSHCEIQRILAEKDAAVRVERLLPYYLSRTGYGFKNEARDGIIGAGIIAGPYLMGVFKESAPGWLQGDILQLFGKIGYRDSVPMLVELLKTQDTFWAGQAPKLKGDWWSNDVDARLTQIRRDNYTLVYNSVYALGQIADPRAREALELTRRRWDEINFSNHQIGEECSRSLQAIDKANPASSPK